MSKVIHKELSYKITGLLFEAHKELGRYRSEKQFSDYFEKLLIRENIFYKREYRFIDQKNGQGNVRCVCDYIIEGKIILELKSKDHLSKEDYFQLKRYLVTLNLELGILVNFRQPRLVPKRILNANYYNKIKYYNTNITNEHPNNTNATKRINSD